MKKNLAGLFVAAAMVVSYAHAGQGEAAVQLQRRPARQQRGQRQRQRRGSGRRGRCSYTHLCDME